MPRPKAPPTSPLCQWLVLEDALDDGDIGFAADPAVKWKPSATHELTLSEHVLRPLPNQALQTIYLFLYSLDVEKLANWYWHLRSLYGQDMPRPYVPAGSPLPPVPNIRATKFQAKRERAEQRKAKKALLPRCRSSSCMN